MGVLDRPSHVQHPLNRAGPVGAGTGPGPDPARVADLARAQLGLGRPDAAFALLARHEVAHGQHPVLIRLAARALLAMGLRGPAAGSLYAALERYGEEAETLGLLADALFQDGRHAEALAPGRRAFELQRSAAHATTLSCILSALGRDAEALAVTDGGMRTGPESPELWLNRSVALEGLGRQAEAVESARAALRLAPRSAVAQHHLATALLVRGEMTAESWDLYEGRLRLNGTGLDGIATRRWRGEDVAGRTVLLHAEQGLGDTLQFARYVPLVATRAARVVLAVQPALVRLLAPLPGADQVVAIGGPLPSFDVFAPLLSLPGILGTTLHSIPGPIRLPLPLSLPGTAIRGPVPDGPLHVGLAWAGNPGFVADRERSLDPALLDTLARMQGVVFHSLQAGPAAIPRLLRFKGDLVGVRDMADTASRMSGLDLVISVDTAVVHLAGTLGLPVWLLSRFRGCWRWLQGRTDSPWYPGLRIHRQARPGDWAGVLASVRSDLEILAAQRLDHVEQVDTGPPPP